jgi:C-terminal processing protease CtpA/Prc
MNGRNLFAFLWDKPFMYYSNLEMRNNTFTFLSHTDAPDLGRMVSFRTKPNDHGSFDFLMHPNLGEQQPQEPVFHGQVWVLINGGSFSGSGETTTAMHQNKRAVFVGEECGAGYYGNTSGVMPTLTLPNTGYRIRIPMVRYIMAAGGYPYPDRGILPDYPYQRSITDYLSGKDSEMEYVLDLIEVSR